MKVKTMTYRNGLFFNNEYIEMNVERGTCTASHRVAGNAGSIGKYFPYSRRGEGAGPTPE